MKTTRDEINDLLIDIACGILSDLLAVFTNKNYHNGRPPIVYDNYVKVPKGASKTNKKKSRYDDDDEDDVIIKSDEWDDGWNNDW